MYALSELDALCADSFQPTDSQRRGWPHLLEDPQLALQVCAPYPRLLPGHCISASCSESEVLVNPAQLESGCKQRRGTHSSLVISTWLIKSINGISYRSGHFVLCIVL